MEVIVQSSSLDISFIGYTMTKSLYELEMSTYSHLIWTQYSMVSKQQLVSGIVAVLVTFK